MRYQRKNGQDDKSVLCVDESDITRAITELLERERPADAARIKHIVMDMQFDEHSYVPLKVNVYLRKEPNVGEKWRHFKGDVYDIEGFAKGTATKEPMVLYRKADRSEDILWARLLSVWTEVPMVKSSAPGFHECSHGY